MADAAANKQLRMIFLDLRKWMSTVSLHASRGLENSRHGVYQTSSRIYIFSCRRLGKQTRMTSCFAFHQVRGSHLVLSTEDVATITGDV